MTGKRLIVGAILMGIVLPAVLFFLLKLQTVSQYLTIAAATFLIWGVADLLASILERPRLEDRTPGRALREDWERRRTED
ncbi:MAG TPA: hypothetical protein VL284_01395 [Thermoanaerobaculia bacterium]|nr:hypothetical protein [Thermoanaerobaculia bacterium]